MHFTLLGFGVEGRSTYQYLVKKYPQAEIEIRDKNNINVPEGVTFKFGEKYLDNLSSKSTIFRSPSILPHVILESNPHFDMNNVTHQIDYFLRNFQGFTIGITGTKGKGTTSTLIYDIIKASGKEVHLVGNIGNPPLDVFQEIQETDIVVLELSSFQLIDLQISPNIAVMLKVTQEHLDFHKDLDEYIEAKAPLVKYQKEEDLAVINTMLESSKLYMSYVKGKIQEIDTSSITDSISISENIFIDCSELKLLGKHNFENIMPAIAVAQYLEISPKVIHSTVLNFSGLEHRLELCGTKDNIDIYNDSFGTIPETAIVAINSFPERNITWFLGGSYKGSDYTELCHVISKSTVKNIILIPPMGEKIWNQFQELYPNKINNYKVYDYLGSMEKSVPFALEISKPGDVILLSCACASFGEFKNYKERGKLFKQAVQKLTK